MRYADIFQPQSLNLRTDSRNYFPVLAIELTVVITRSYPASPALQASPQQPQAHAPGASSSSWPTSSTQQDGL